MQAGARYGGYVLERRIHEGAHFDYWLARDAADRSYVAALLHPPLPADEHLAQLQSAVSDRRAIRHARIPLLVDVVEGDTIMLVYERVPGVTVRTILDRAGSLPEVIAARVVERIARTVHEARIPSRWCSLVGIEPKNILVDPAGAPHLLLAPIIEMPADPTGAGMINQAVVYMSPEAIMGVPLLPQSTVFSLGLLLYELLSGVHPFRRESLMQALYRLLNSDYEPISNRVSVSSEIERILERALSRAPEERHLHAGELADALDAMLPASTTETAIRTVVRTHAPELDDPEHEQRDTVPIPPADEETRLRAAILADRDAVDPHLVYADWLQSRGRARGELILLQHQRHPAAAAFLADHPELVGDLLPYLDQPNPERPFAFDAGPHFIGDLSKGPIALEWHLGFIKSMRISLGRTIDGPRALERLFRQLSSNEAAQFLRRLAIGPIDDSTYQSFAALRAELDSLFVGDLSRSEMRSVHRATANVSSLFPSLVRLAIRGAEIHLGRLVLPELRELRIFSAGLTAETINHVASSALPKLEHLELWFGGPPARSAWPDRVGVLFEDRHLPKLRSLALSDREPQAILATIAVLASSDLAKRLERLDLSQSAIGPQDVLQNKEVFPRLVEVCYPPSSQKGRSGPTSSIG